MEMQGQANVSATGHGIWVAIPAVFQALNVQMHTWSTYLQQYAANIESHHASFHKAKEAIANSHGMEHDLEVSATQKFAALGRNVSELRQSLQQHH
jgi:hypothetical protein